MYDFVIDTGPGDYAGDISLADKNDSDGGENFISLDELPEPTTKQKRSKKHTQEDDEFSIDNSYLITHYSEEHETNNENKFIDKLMEQSVIKPGFEKLIAVPVGKGKRALKRERKSVRDKTKGKDWYNLPATNVTEEIKNDLDILKMRSALDSKHVYKKNDIKVIPKYFQVGRVVEGAADFYNGRIPKSQRKRTMVDELLADSNFKAYQKKKYKEIVDDRRHKRKNVGVKKERIKKKNSKDDWLSWD